MERSLRICLAEDDTELRLVLKRMIEMLGHRVECTVSDGEQAVDRARELQVDLVIVDLDMPVMDGLAAAELISATTRIPVILLSGHPDFQEIVRENEPISTYLQKPVTLDMLRIALRETMARRMGSVQK